MTKFKPPYKSGQTLKNFKQSEKPEIRKPEPNLKLETLNLKQAETNFKP
jgi:hypothetical protein